VSTATEQSETGLRIAVVTGSGRGIGREHALAFARRGVAVVVNDLGGSSSGEGASAGPADEVVELIRKEGGEAVANADDVSEPEGAKHLIETALREFGRLDIVVNNAGILRDKTLLNMDVADWDAVIKVHLRGTFLVTQAAGRYWRDESKAGRPHDARVVNTTSGSGLFGNFGQTNYGAAKGAIASFTVISAMELGRYGVNVNAIAPVAKTRLLATAGASEDIEEGFDPLAPQHVSPFVVWLGSPESKGVTGRCFSVVGGYVGIAEGWRIGPSVMAEEGPLTFEEIDARFPAEFAKAAPNFDVRQSHPYMRASS
jgi:NAD(P)-dependent dehydrogenase (short-subunit alcohol dehydrogenase family)